MKHDHFLDAGSFGLSCAPPEFGDVRVADRAINEAAELQMDEALCIGEVYGLTRHGFHHRRRQHVSWLEFHGFPSHLSDPRPIYRFRRQQREPQERESSGHFASASWETPLSGLNSPLNVTTQLDCQVQFV